MRCVILRVPFIHSRRCGARCGASGVGVAAQPDAMELAHNPFIGSEALAAGAFTRYELRRYYHAILPNVYLDKRVTPTLRHRIQAAWLWSRRDATVAGASAAALLGAKWVDVNGPIELIWSNARPPKPVITRADLLLSDERQKIGNMMVTTPERTAFDIGRRGRFNDAVARLDALGNATGFEADDVRTLAGRHPHVRGLRQLDRALHLYDPGAQSPKETWLRLMAIEEGFPRPRTQIPVPGPDGHPMYYLDMGWEHLMLALEYDGRQHADALAYDIARHEYIAELGWTTIRVAAGDRPPSITRRLHRAWNRLSPPFALR